jgi:hypothetical protein
VMVFRPRAPPLLVTPHDDVRVVDPVAECAALSPNFVKCLLGEPRRHRGATLEVTEHPMLAPFASCGSVEDIVELLVDLRECLTVTPDEHDFLELWEAHMSNTAALPRSDRWVERLCLRYAGQSPKRLTTLLHLAQTLSADAESGLHNSLGLFSDASHYARVCRACTRQPPTRWRNMSRTFY